MDLKGINRGGSQFNLKVILYDLNIFSEKAARDQNAQNPRRIRTDCLSRGFEPAKVTGASGAAKLRGFGFWNLQIQGFYSPATAL